MILKAFELNKDKIKDYRLFLFYGQNVGLKKQAIKNLIDEDDEILRYEEKEIISDENKFFESTLNKSLFEPNKTIIIKRVSDKIIKIIEAICDKNIEEIKIILDSESLEKKSKLRSFFEKNKKLITVAFYPDNDQTILKLAHDFFKRKNIPISSSNINIIVNKCSGDRDKLFNELKKIESYCKKGKKITPENISKLININENYSISELVDNCLAKNKNKTINILNENYFTEDDCVLITRVFLNKLKKILILSNQYKINKNIDLTVASARPPIFWKEKEIVKKQILEWSPKNIKKLIYKINELELSIKKNFSISTKLVVDLILSQTSTKTSN